jgi:membrane protein DedA with SNARE-associated domain
MNGGDPRPVQGFRRRLPPTWLLAVLAIVVLTLVVLAVAFLEGDLPEGFGDVRTFLFREVLVRFGVPGSLALLYVEESGVPLPVPGDVYVAYLGHSAEGAVARWIAAAIAIVLVVVAGSSNLYLASRLWGERLLRGRLGHVLHANEANVARAERWLARWGPIVIIFGRHLPGFRIPITLVAGTFRVRYWVFATSVAFSTSLWVAAWFALQARFGRQIGHFILSHRWTYLVIAAAVVLAVVSLVVRAVRSGPSMSEGLRR